jgi:16S rRNA (guanine527-N7)-methyltransferase
LRTPDAHSDLRVSRETEADLDLYLSLLGKWQSVKNLVGGSTLPDALNRHVKDSLQLLPLAPATATQWVDIGSGGGFPGMVIAIALKQNPLTQVHLVESDHRKCAFLRAVARETGARALVHCGRIEDVLPTLPQADVISARALAEMVQLMEWTAPMIEKGAIGLFLKGRDVGAELTHLTRYSKFSFKLVPSTTASDAAVVVVSVGHTPPSERGK